MAEPSKKMYFCNGSKERLFTQFRERYYNVSDKHLSIFSESNLK